MQALEVIKLITGIGSLLKGRLLVFDGYDAQFDEIPIRRNDKCPVCGI
jgi:adenylyltransferase/sulfurtransferase